MRLDQEVRRVLGASARTLQQFVTRRPNAGSRRPEQEHAAITVRRPVEEVYALWRELENLPAFMGHLEAVRVIDPKRSHWVARAPGGTTVAWDAQLLDEVPNVLLAWESVEGSDIRASGVVQFRPAPRDQGTEIVCSLAYAPPAGAVGQTIAKLLGEDPGQQIRDDLRRFKQMAETGVVVVSEGSPEGTTARRQLKQRAAQPVT